MINGKFTYPRIMDSISRAAVVSDVPLDYGDAALKAIGKELDIVFMCIDKLEERILDLEDKLDER